MASRPTIHLMVPPPLYVNGAYGMNQSVINTIFPGETAAGIRPIAKVGIEPRILALTLSLDVDSEAMGLGTPIDLYGLFQAHCPVKGGTTGHPPNNTDTPCDWLGSGGRDGCHPSNSGYGKVAAAVRGALAPPV